MIEKLEVNNLNLKIYFQESSKTGANEKNSRKKLKVNYNI